MGKIEYIDLGEATIVHTTKKAALVKFDNEDYSEQWIPFSVISVGTSAQVGNGIVLDSFQIETWFVDKME